MGLKDIYTALEDKWYGLLDKIDTHAPVYKLVDEIDKVVPSFLVFIAVVVALAAFFAVMPLLPIGQHATVTLFVENESGNALQGVAVDYTIGGIINSRQTDSTGKITFNTPFDSSVDIRVAETTVNGIEYEQKQATISVGSEASATRKLVLIEKLSGYIERQLIFQNSSGERVTGELITVRLDCQNNLAQLPERQVEDEDMDGIITVMQSRDCGAMNATIVAPEKYKYKSYAITDSMQIIMLEGQAIGKGSLRVKVKDSTGKLLTETNFSVKLMESSGSLVNEKYTLSYGEAIFTGITIGNYSITVEDLDGGYALANIAEVSILADETSAIDVVLSKSVKATINVSVAEKGSGQGIANAQVRLLDSEGNMLSEKSTGADAQDVSFYLMDRGNYTLIAMHPEYLYEIAELEDTADAEIRLELEKITPQNSGRVQVKVLDEEAKPVHNAKVKLRFLETGMLAPYSPATTDRNGNASFTGVKAGSYYAYVEKFPAFGDNKGEGKEIDIREATYFTVNLFIGKSLVRVTALDEDKRPVNEAEAEFFGEGGESLGKIPLPQGTGQYELKADKRVYAVVRHENYMAVHTMPKQLWPSQPIEFRAVMEPRLIMGEPQIQFEGLYDLAGKQVQVLRAGSRYLVKFKLSVPEAGNFGQGGFHYRVGDERLLVNDALVIKDVIAGNVRAVQKGTSFTAPLGYETDSENLTAGDAKWASVEWAGLETGNYYFGFEIRVKSQIAPYTRLPMHYRAWAVDEAGDYIRAPYDSQLGIAESTAEKQELYAKTFDLQFLEGAESECQEDFCYSGESIIDGDMGLYIYEPYEMRAGSSHTLTFDILNNSERQYDSSELYITVVGSTITSYKITNASAQEITAESVSTKEIEAIDLGSFTKGKSISSEIEFTPSKQGNASIEIKVIADARTVFTKTITAWVKSEREMQISVQPEVIAAYIANELQVTVDEQVGSQRLGVRDALVRATITHPDRPTEFYTKMTCCPGRATFDLGELEPNTEILIEAEKPEYYAAPVTVFVDTNVLRFSPNKINSVLDTRGTKEQTFSVEVENVTGIGLEIKNISLAGTFKGLLDQATMENYSRQHIGIGIRPGNAIAREMFKTKLSANAREILFTNQTVNGHYLVTATNQERSILWDMIVPLQVKAVIGELPDNSPCLIITKQNWEGSTVENTATTEFEVQNNCVSGSSFVELDSLQAKLEWQSDALGTVELTLIEAETGSSNSEVLRPGMWTRLFKTAQADSTYYAMLTLTPKQGHLGETAKFTVEIDGEIATGSGMAFVGASPSKISADIKIINLQQCIKYIGAENIVELSAGQEDATFTVDASDCGKTDVMVELCRQNPNCSGGAEGGITVTPLSFTLNKDSPEREVLVRRQSIPGMYGINVEAKVPGTSFREVQTLDILMHPETGNDFSLDKYEINIKGIGASDEAKLTNSALSETVSVDASACDWGTAEEEGMFDLAGAGVGAAIAALLGAKTAIEHASQTTQAINAARAADMTGAVDSVQRANGLVQGASTAGDAAQLAADQTRNVAIKAASVDTKAALTASNAIGGCGAGVQAAVAAANTEMGNIEATANGTFWTKIGRAIASIGRGVGRIASGLGHAITGRNTASPNETTAVSTGPYNSTKDIDNAIGEVDTSASDLGESYTGWGESLAENQGMAAGLATVQSSLESSELELGAAHGCCSAEGESCAPQVDSASAAITKAQTSVATAIQAAEASGVKITDAQGAAGTAVNGLADARTSLGTAKTSMGSLGSTMAATGQAAGFSKGKFFGILGTYAALGAIAGGLLGGIFGEDPCDQRVTATLMDYAINLKEDSQPLTVDKQGISAAWETEDAQVFGTYDKQEAGIKFTNTAIEPGKPVYATVRIPSTRHYHSNPTTISRGNSGFGPFKVPDLRAETYSQKIHLKFNTKEIVLEIPPVPDEESCLMGTLVGRTGHDALPKVKLNWSWAENGGIGINECDYMNDEAVYCDATQFSIMVNKRLHALDEFLRENMPLPCPQNPAIENLEELGAEFNETLDELGLQGFAPIDIASCWLPRSTVLYDNKPALLYYVEANLESIAWTEEIPDLDSLQEILHFKAYLMKDGYTNDFQSDFAEFYTTSAFYDPPEWFISGSERLANLFEDTDSLRFRTRYSGQNTLSSAGLYDATLAINFHNEDWRFFYADLPDSETVVDLYLAENPYPDSIFYSLPFNGNIGKESFNGRIGYGLNFENRKEDILISFYPGESINTGRISGSTTAASLETDIVTDLKKINTSASSRGFLMDFTETGSSGKKLVFSPNYATPLVLKMPASQTDEPFSAFYQLQETLAPVEAGTTLGFWTGAGQCLDFTGIPAFEAFDFKPDREATGTDRLQNWEFAYAVDWPKADYKGTAYLKTVFFTPTAGIYSMKSLEPAGMMFITPNSNIAKTVELSGITGMLHNSRDSVNKAESLQDVFDLVETGHVCVTNSGTRTAFWWNPQKLYETAGPYTSIEQLEQGLTAGQSCIGYGS
ncbi:MAG: carboxypeptidase regulatory-like domain-containing protein [Candidatus Diapherotrites archaeon]|uniref:Carboxypeptidase regulatory-like domain-containing protein n=1 Tax=Candidatus Iainarchaeum sp. TaxID=3101447 RepID=A0A939C8Q2_9ARCH|nr:carboxypeptidase regulatory-like domain-containing protein [Candidatus Diapherotrites archaeon]